MANELTQITAEAQVQQVIKWIIGGSPSFDVAGAIVAQYPQANVADLLCGAMLHFEQAGDFDSQVVTGWVFESTKEVYRQALEAGDFSTALRALSQIGKMADVRRGVEVKEEEK